MEIYCLLCGSKLRYYDEINPEQTPKEYKQNGVVGVYECLNKESCKAELHIIDLDLEDVDYEDIYMTREIRYFFPEDIEV